MNPTNLIEDRHRSSDDIIEFVRSVERAYMLDRPQTKEADRRKAGRLVLTMPVDVLPLDDELQPIDEKRSAVTRDISGRGVGMVMTNPVPLSYVSLTFQPLNTEPFDVIARVIWCNAVGHYFHLGCKFLAK